ncbi:MAG: sugar ABC transporter permease [Clostridia bacterium]|nr:sugar ABC transporter permease [Clostridia bacterium]
MNSTIKLRRRRKILKAIEPYLFCLPLIFCLFGLFAYPMIRAVIISFQRYKLTELKKVRFIGFDNYINSLRDKNLGMITWNSIKYVVIVVGLQFVLGFGLALALRRPFRFRNVYQAVAFIPYALSGFVCGLMFRWSFNGEYGVVNDLLMKLHITSSKIAFLGTPGLSIIPVYVAAIWLGYQFFAIMLLAALQSIPQEVYESAELDGCGWWRRLFSIIIPYIRPTLLTILMLRVVWTFNSYELIYVITEGGPASSSETLTSYLFTRAYSNLDFGAASALGLMFAVVLLICAGIYMKLTKYNQAGDF